MNKVYEGILVRVKDGEITGPEDSLIVVAKNAQRARDLLIREFATQITTVEGEESDWDIIVREFK